MNRGRESSALFAGAPAWFAAAHRLADCALMADGRCPDAPAGLVRAIQRRVGEAYGLDLLALNGRAHSARVVQARHAAMWIARETTQMSLLTIGRLSGGRDHTTVFSALKRVAAARAADPAFARRLDRLKAEFGA